MIDQLCKEITVADLPDEESLKNWLQEQAGEYELKYLLAHADDGVIWGKFDRGTLAIAKDAFPQFPPLHPITLQQCRAFGEKAEVLLWRVENSWKSRIIEHHSHIDFIEESAILWGTRIKEEKDRFSLLSDGQQELEHAVPLIGIESAFNQSKPSNPRPLRLIIHHYFNDDAAGINRIFLSRLVNLTIIANTVTENDTKTSTSTETP